MCLFLRSHATIFHLSWHYLLTYSTEQSPSWEANRFSASQEIPLISRNLKVHYCIHKRSPPVPILSQLDPVHTLTSYFLTIHLNIILPSVLGSLKWSLSPPKPCIHPSNPPLCATCPILLMFQTLAASGWRYLVNKIMNLNILSIHERSISVWII